MEKKLKYMKRFSNVRPGDEIFIAHVDEKVKEPYVEKLWVPEILTNRELCIMEGWTEELIDDNVSDGVLHIRFDEMKDNAFSGMITVNRRKSCVEFPSMTDVNEKTYVCTSSQEALKLVKSEIIRRCEDYKKQMTDINNHLQHLLTAQKRILQFQ